MNEAKLKELRAAIKLGCGHSYKDTILLIDALLEPSSPASAKAAEDISAEIKDCPICHCAVFLYPSGNIVPHYGPYRLKCEANGKNWKDLSSIETASAKADEPANSQNDYCPSCGSVRRAVYRLQLFKDNYWKDCDDVWHGGPAQANGKCAASQVEHTEGVCVVDHPGHVWQPLPPESAKPVVQNPVNGYCLTPSSDHNGRHMKTESCKEWWPESVRKEPHCISYGCPHCGTSPIKCKHYDPKNAAVPVSEGVAPQKELDDARNEASTCDDIKLDQPLAGIIADLQKDRERLHKELARYERLSGAQSLSSGPKESQ